MSYDITSIFIRIVMQFLPILLWIVIEVSYLDKIVWHDTVGEGMSPSIRSRYDVFSLLISLTILSVITSANQILSGNGIFVIIWSLFAVICTLLLNPLVTAKDNEDEIKMFNLKEYLIEHKIRVTLFIFISITLTELISIFIPIPLTELILHLI